MRWSYRVGAPADELRRNLADLRQRAASFAAEDIKALEGEIAGLQARLAEIIEDRAAFAALIPQYQAALAALGEPEEVEG